MAIFDNTSCLETLQDLEEIPGKSCSPRERNWERDLTDALLEISDKLSEDDQKSVELLIGTGWEEAVCGWGPISATACLHPQKKQRKAKIKEPPDCLLCLDILFLPDNKDGTSDLKASIHSKQKDQPQGEPRPPAVTTAPAEEDLPSGFTGHCPSPATVSTTETLSDTGNPAATEEQRQSKDRNAQRISSPFTGRPIPVCTNCYNTRDLPMVGSPVLLPPLKVAAGHTEHMARRREFLMQQFERLHLKGYSGAPLNNHLLNNTDRRLEVLGEIPQEPRVPEPLSFVVPCAPKTPPIKDSDRLHWPRSLQEQRLNVGHYSMKPNNNSAPVGFLHAKASPSKRNVSQEERRRAKSDTTAGPRNTVLPSLTVTRVDIPPRIKMC